MPSAHLLPPVWRDETAGRKGCARLPLSVAMPGCAIPTCRVSKQLGGATMRGKLPRRPIVPGLAGWLGQRAKRSRRPAGGAASLACLFVPL
jgi:hypothetical protein